MNGRGHTAVLVGGRQTEEFARRRGLEFATVGERGDRDRDLGVLIARLGSSDGMRHARDMFAAMRLHSKILIDDLPSVVHDQGLDGLVADTLAPGAAVVGEQCELPYVVAHAAFISSMAAASAVAGGARRPRRRRRPIRRGLNRVLEQSISIALPPAQKLLYRVDPARPTLLVVDRELGLARISQQPEWFDVPDRGRPAHFHHTGPWTRPPPGGASPGFDWEALDDRPLVYASMGTIFNRRPLAFESILAAVEDLPVQVVVTRGGGEVELSREPPANVVLVDFAPQLDLLDRAAVCVNHAGLSTVFECIERDVPMLCLPSSGESHAIADRIEAHRLGEVVRDEVPRVAEVRDRLVRLLEDPEPRRVAEAFGRRLRSVDGVAVAIDIVESALLTGERVLSRRAGSAT